MPKNENIIQDVLHDYSKIVKSHVNFPLVVSLLLFSLYGAIFQVWQYDSKKSLRFFIHTYKTEESYCTKFYLFFVAFTSFIPMEMVAKLCHSTIYIPQYHSTKSSASSTMVVAQRFCVYTLRKYRSMKAFFKRSKHLGISQIIAI